MNLSQQTKRLQALTDIAKEINSRLYQLSDSLIPINENGQKMEEKIQFEGSIGEIENILNVLQETLSHQKNNLSRIEEITYEQFYGDIVASDTVKL